MVGSISIIFSGFELDLLSDEEDEECTIMCSDCLRCTIGEDQRCCGERDCVETEFSRAVEEKTSQSHTRKAGKGGGEEEGIAVLGIGRRMLRPSASLHEWVHTLPGNAPPAALTLM